MCCLYCLELESTKLNSSWSWLSSMIELQMLAVKSEAVDSVVCNNLCETSQ